MSGKSSVLVTISLFVVSVSGQDAVKGGVITVTENVEREVTPFTPFTPTTYPLVDCVHRPQRKGVCILIGVKTFTSKVVFEGDEQKYAVPFMVRDGEFKFKLNPKQEFDYISLIHVTNLLKPEHQGYVTVTDGGVGDQKVTLYFESLRGEGYHFHIQIFADSRMQPQQQKQIQKIPYIEPFIEGENQEGQITGIEEQVSQPLFKSDKEERITQGDPSPKADVREEYQMHGTQESAPMNPKYSRRQDAIYYPVSVKG